MGLSRKPPNVSVLVPCRSAGAAQACLVAIAKNTDPSSNYAVVVVDGTSSEIFARFLDGIEGALRVIRSEPAARRTRLLGMAAAAAQTELVAVIDERVRPLPGWLDALLAAHRELGPGLGVAGCVVTDGAGNLIEAGFDFDAGRPISLAALAQNVNNAWLSSLRDVAVAGHGGCLTSRSLLAAFEGEYNAAFDARWARLCLDAGRGGLRVVLAPGALLEASPSVARLIEPSPESGTAPRIAAAMIECMRFAGQIGAAGEPLFTRPGQTRHPVLDPLDVYSHLSPLLSGHRVFDWDAKGGAGCDLIAGKANAVVGFTDTWEQALWARSLWRRSNLNFRTIDAFSREPAARFDVGVHLALPARPHQVLTEMTQLLADSGELFVRFQTSSGSVDAAPLKDAFLGYFGAVESAAAAPGLLRCSKPRRFDADLVSIVIPVRNGRELTRQCLESVAEFTGRRHEVIVVDNASADGTAEILARAPAVKVITNSRNLGFALAVNQGIRESNGGWLLVLNNDTALTPGWLDGLLQAARAKSVGLAGPVTNYGPPNQLTSGAAYTDRAGMLEFAESVRRDGAGSYRPVVALSGVCLLIKREVIQEIGGFDPRFGLGYFEDGDFGLRARLAGYELIVVGDVYIHHEGSQTAQSEGIDSQALMAANWEVLKRKWDIHIEGPGGPAEQAPRVYARILRRPFRLSECYVGDLWRRPPEELSVRGGL